MNDVLVSRNDYLQQEDKNKKLFESLAPPRVRKIVNDGIIQCIIISE